MASAPQPELFVRWFRQVAPYVHAFRGRTFVVAFGGEVAADRARLAHFAQDLNLLAALGIRLILVHGSRPQIDAELKAKKLRSRFVRGLRVTDANALTAVKHAVGVLRVELEAMLSQGLPNSPMSGAAIRVASGNFIAARPIGILDGVDYQYTGEVRRIDAQAITRRLDAGEVVLVSHTGYSPSGEVFNIAWENVASSVAIALKADKLMLFSDRLPADAKGEVVGELTARQAGALLEQGDLGPATTRALQHALRALKGGVVRTHLVSRRMWGSILLELFTHWGVGTMITADPIEKLREATIEDIGGILALIEPLEAEGSLVKRGRDVIESEIANFVVLEHDRVILGCAALHPYPDAKSAEFACLAVAPDYRDAGYGERLLGACEERARARKMRRLFALTTRAAHWFLDQGFRESTPDKLPAQRQSLYNWKRGSKVFLKRL